MGRKTSTSRTAVRVIRRSEDAAASLALALRSAGFNAESASGVDASREPADRPGVLVIDCASALLEHDELLRLLTADPALQLLVIGAETEPLARLGEEALWVPLSAHLVEDLAIHLRWACDRRAAAFHLEAVAAELRSTEEQRAELSHRFNELVEEVRDVIFEFDLEGRVLAVNSACADVTGYSRTEASSLQVRDLLGTELAAVLDLLDGDRGQPRLVVARRRTGQPFLAEVTVVPIVHNGAPIGGRAILRDVSRRERTEEQLRRLGTFHWMLTSTLDRSLLLQRVAAELPAVTGVSRHALFLLDPAAQELRLVSPPVLEPLRVPAGVDTSNLLACSLRATALIGAAGAAHSQLGHCPRISTLMPGSVIASSCCSEGPKPEAACASPPVGACRWCPLAAILEREALLIGLHSGSQPIGVLLLTGPDRTGWQTEAEAAHLALVGQYLSVALNNTHLHAETVTYAGRLERTLADLRVAQDELARAERLAAFSQVAMRASHEIRNPLNAIGLMLHNLKEEIGDLAAPAPAPRPEPGELAARAARIQTEVLRLKTILDDILLVARNRPAPSRPVDFTALARAAVETLEAQLAAQNVTAVLDLVPDLPTVLGDPEEVRRALINLVLNAAEAMPRGGTLTVRTRHEEGELVCSVRDTGTGISANDRHRIFDPFFTTKARGTGLGLSLVDRVVRELGGQLVVVSEPGQGSEFTLRLPRNAGREATL